MTEEHPNERLVTPSDDGEGFDRSLVSRRSMLGGSALLAGLLAYTSDPTDPQLPGRASGSAAGIARASDNPDEPLIILGPESDPVGYLFQDTAGGIILQDATSGNHFWYNEAQGRWETDAELNVPSLVTESLDIDGIPAGGISTILSALLSNASSNFDLRANDAVTVSTTATPIWTGTGNLSLVFVFGGSGASRFIDMVGFGNAVGPTDTEVGAGTGITRTYTRDGSDLDLEMGSSTFDVATVGFSVSPQ